MEGVTLTPDYMNEGEVECTGCHDLKSGESQNVVIVKEKCAECHDDSYAEMALSWEKEILSLENVIAVNLVEAEELVTRMRRLGRDTVKLEELLDSARKSYDLVSQGRGIHNYELSITMLENASGNLQRILERTL